MVIYQVQIYRRDSNGFGKWQSVGSFGSEGDAILSMAKWRSAGEMAQKIIIVR